MKNMKTKNNKNNNTSIMEHIQKNYKKIIILMLGLLATAIGVFAISKRFTKQKTDSIAISNKNFSFEVKKKTL